MSQVSETSVRFERLPMKIGISGVVVLAACIAAGIAYPADFFRSYLVGYLLWLGMALGCLAVLMMQHVTSGMWAFVIRRFLEAGSRTLPLMAVATVPLLFGLRVLYAWARPGQSDAQILAKHSYLNLNFFIVREIIYFAVWLALAYFLNKWSQAEEEGQAGLPLWIRMESLSGFGLVLYGLTMTFASVDWVMSLEPKWSSTIYGLIFMVGQMLGALAFAVVMLAWLSDRKPLFEILKPTYFQDLGSFLLTFVMLWAYLQFSQYLIIWGENLTSEIPWYVLRMQGSWGAIGLVLIVLNFALPFFMLLFRHIKRRARLLVIVAGLLLVMRLVDMLWMVLPSFGGANAPLTWMNVVLPLAMGGIWFAYFLWQLERLPILAVHDQRMETAMEQVAEHG